MKYITHNQWSGDNKFIEFYHRVLNEEWDKIIIFCQNEWEWYNHEPVHWKLLQEHCKSIGRHRFGPLETVLGIIYLLIHFLKDQLIDILCKDLGF
jgi:hypothetical protein